MNAGFCYNITVLLAIVIFQFGQGLTSTLQKSCYHFLNGTTKSVPCQYGCCRQYTVHPCCVLHLDIRESKSHHHDFDYRGPQFQPPPSFNDWDVGLVDGDDDNNSYKVPTIPIVLIAFILCVLSIFIRWKTNGLRTCAQSNNPDTVSIDNIYMPPFGNNTVPPSGNNTVVHNPSGNMVLITDMDSNAQSTPPADILDRSSTFTAYRQYSTMHEQHVMPYEAPPPSYDEVMSRQSAV